MLDSHSYTIGLASRGYEIVTNMFGVENLVLEMLNVPNYSTPVSGKVYISEEAFCKSVSAAEPTKFSFVEIVDRKFIQLLSEHLCLGWRNRVYGKIPEKVYLAVVGDANNKLPWEKGFVSHGNDLPSLVDQVIGLEKASLNRIESSLIEKCVEEIGRNGTKSSGDSHQRRKIIPIEESSIQTDSSGKALALDFVMRYGGIDGDHHKTWVIDQVVRALHNVPVTVTRRSWSDGSFRDDVEQSTNEAYENWVKSYNDGEDGPDTYEWGVGIAP